jgi:hypothetical protein
MGFCMEFIKYDDELSPNGDDVGFATVSLDPGDPPCEPSSSHGNVRRCSLALNHTQDIACWLV